MITVFKLFISLEVYIRAVIESRPDEEKKS